MIYHIWTFEGKYLANCEAKNDEQALAIAKKKFCWQHPMVESEASMQQRVGMKELSELIHSGTRVIFGAYPRQGEMQS